MKTRHWADEVVTMDRIRQEALWLIGAFCMFLLSSGADPKVTRAAIATFALYAMQIVILKAGAWRATPAEPREDSPS